MTEASGIGQEQENCTVRRLSVEDRKNLMESKHDGLFQKLIAAL
jgi:hypothetical protein